jgi:hypothetical protein
MINYEEATCPIQRGEEEEEEEEEKKKKWLLQCCFIFNFYVVLYHNNIRCVQNHSRKFADFHICDYRSKLTEGRDINKNKH